MPVVGNEHAVRKSLRVQGRSGTPPGRYICKRVISGRQVVLRGWAVDEHHPGVPEQNTTGLILSSHLNLAFRWDIDMPMVSCAEETDI